MELEHKIDKMEEELTILKNEVKTTLLDIREYVLANEGNPLRMLGFNRPNPDADINDSVQNLEQNPYAGKKDRGGNGNSRTGDNLEDIQSRAEKGDPEHDSQSLKGDKEEVVSGADSVQGEVDQPLAFTSPDQAEAGEQQMSSLSPTQEYYSDAEGGSSMPPPLPGQKPGDIISDQEWMDQPDEVANNEEDGPLFGRSYYRKKDKLNLLTLAGLARWAERSVGKIGKERVESIVEIYGTAGNYFPESYKETITHIISLTDGENTNGPVAIWDSISVLLQLDSLLEGNFKNEAAALSTLFDDGGGYPWTKP